MGPSGIEFDQDDDWHLHFPIDESYEACDGRMVAFQLTADETPTGFLARAEETQASRGDRHGFHLSAFSPVSPYLALGALRDTIRRRLSTKYLRRQGGDVQMTHDQLVGVVDYAADIDERILQVDGDMLTFEELKNLISTYEGFQVTIAISEQG